MKLNTAPSPLIQKELTAILFENLLLGFTSISLVSLILIWQLYGEIKASHLWAWFVILNLNLLGGVGVVYWYQKTRHQLSMQNYHIWAYILGSSVTSILFGILGSVLMPEHISHQLLVILIILSITGAAVQNLHASYLAASCYLSFSLIPLVGWEVIQALNGDHLYVAVLAATLIFMSYLVIDVYSGYAMLENNIKLKIDNIETANTVAYQKNMMELLSTMLSRFQRCINEQEVYDVFYDIIDQIFITGSVFIYAGNGNKQILTMVHRKGIIHGQQQSFTADECHAVADRIPYNGFKNNYCEHFLEPTQYTTCIPLLASDELFGVICLMLERKLSFIEENFIYRSSAGLALSISNLKLRESLNKALVHDALTKLYNRYYLDSIVEKLIMKANDTDKSLAFILLDIDYFKMINDTYGHGVGDATLVEFSKRLKNFFYDTDLVFRYGGEEFLIILEDISLSKACFRTNLFRKEIKNNFLILQDCHLKLSVSGGVSSYPLHGDNFSALIKAADNALYVAKNAGRDHIVAANKTINKFQI